MNEIVIRHDLHLLDRYWRAVLTQFGALEDLKMYEGQLKPCDLVTIDAGDIKVLAVLDYDHVDGDRSRAKEWVASPVWSTTRPRS
jgi:hypothetical protein